MIRVYGIRDDLAEVEGHDSVDEIGCSGRDIVLIFGEVSKGGVALRVSYRPRFPHDAKPPGCHRSAGWSCWSIEISQLAEQCPIPWPITVAHVTELSGYAGYSVIVSIDAPSSTPLRVVEVPLDSY